MIKKFAVLFMTVALAVGAVVPSYANTYDKNYAFTVSAKHYVTPAFSKDGTTKVYAYYTVRTVPPGVSDLGDEQR